MGFYYIPTTVKQPKKSELKSAMVRVVEGSMTVAQVESELARLVSAK